MLCGPEPRSQAESRRQTSSALLGIRSRLSLQTPKRPAAAAVKLIEVEYEDLPGVSRRGRGDETRCAATASRTRRLEYLRPLQDPQRRCGDAGFAKADVIVEGEYQTPVQEHAYLQPEAGLAYIDEEGRVTVVAGGQWTHDRPCARSHIASACPRNRCASSIPPSAAHSADARICRCRSCWRWRPGNYSDPSASSGRGANRSSGMANGIRLSSKPNGARQKTGNSSPPKLN